MRRLERGLGRYDWIGRIDTGFGLASTAGAAAGAVAAILSDWSVAGILLAVFTAGAAFGIAYIGWTVWWDRWDKSHPAILLSAAPILNAQTGPHVAKYVQVAIKAQGSLLGCQVTLCSVAKIDGQSERIVYQQPLNARWSGLPESATDINDGQELHANLFSVQYVEAHKKYLLIPETIHQDEALRLAVARSGVYYITVLASSKSASAQKKRFVMSWGESIEAIEFWDLSREQH